MSSYVLAVSGASAQQIAERSIQLLLSNNHDLDLILSRGAYEVWQAERGIGVPTDPTMQATFWRQRLNVSNGNLTCHRWNNQAATIASGSYQTEGMLIVPCSMGAVGRISSGIATDLIERCADVHLKEGRPLVIAPREMPWNLIHLRNLTALAEAGARIAPLIPGWYTNPTNLDEMVDFLVMRLFDTLGETLTKIPRWQGPAR